MKRLGIGIAVAAFALGCAWWLSERDQAAKQIELPYTASGALGGMDDAMVRTPPNPDPNMVRILPNPDPGMVIDPSRLRDKDL